MANICSDFAIWALEYYGRRTCSVCHKKEHRSVIMNFWDVNQASRQTGSWRNLSFHEKIEQVASNIQLLRHSWLCIFIEYIKSMLTVHTGYLLNRLKWGSSANYGSGVWVYWLVRRQLKLFIKVLFDLRETVTQVHVWMNARQHVIRTALSIKERTAAAKVFLRSTFYIGSNLLGI